MRDLPCLRPPPRRRAQSRHVLVRSGRCVGSDAHFLYLTCSIERQALCVFLARECMCYWPVLCCLFLSSSCPSGVLPQVFNRDVPHGIDMCHRPNPFSCVLLRRLSLVVLLHLVIPAASVTDESVSLLQINPTDALVTDHTDDTSVNEAIERLAAQVPIKPPGIVGRATRPAKM